ncbi:hypothetical protein GQ600_5425 [Phytophthora cactorum]|nr:hypothetical protein GQ600_5425 [Phytophthora cactorum]
MPVWRFMIDTILEVMYWVDSEMKSLGTRPLISQQPMAATLLDLAVPGSDPGCLSRHLLEKLYSKYCQLKEGKELCINLHERLQAFIRELAKVDDQTREKEDLLSRLEALVKEYCRTVLKYLKKRTM